MRLPDAAPATPAIPTTHAARLLAGPRLADGPEPLGAHLARLGPLPSRHGPDVIAELEASGLLGRGGAGFPVGRKWRSVAGRSGGRAVVVANGAEGEVASLKDRTLMASRPHLVLDGAVLAAESVGAREIVLYVGGEHDAAVAALRDALAERSPATRQAVRLVTAPETYVAGEATAAVHYVNAGVALPVTTPPRVSESGVGGRPTLVQNVESLAYAGLIARYGAAWYREAGRGEVPGTALVTVTGPAGGPEVRELELGTTVRELASEAGVDIGDLAAVLLGGYFGTWGRAEDVLDLPLDPAAMRAAGLTFGCGIVSFLPADRCGLRASARIAAFLANESAGQCGPCVHGLRSIADALARVARCEALPDDAANLHRWMPMVARRGACHHPDGAIQLVASALDVFRDDLAAHLERRRCMADGGTDRAA